MQRGEEDFIRTAFEYSFPTNDDVDTESNKSTPYFTPMEFLHSPFEFPTPHLEDAEKKNSNCTSTNMTTQMTAVTTACSYVTHSTNIDVDNLQMIQPKEMEIDKQSPRTIQSCSKSIIKHLEPSSPNFQRKFRRFSLYERRSCSPQHLILKNASSVECTIDTDKENTKPNSTVEKNEESSEGNNSPNIISDETGSPKISTSSETCILSSGRLTYSPKLLSSINNISLASPLGVISSAGYKNGNYFKFPEIDHVVQDVQVQQLPSNIVDDNGTPNRSNHMLKYIAPKNALTAEAGAETKGIYVKDLTSTTVTLPKTETKRNRKNKNNLTIKIVNSSSEAVQPQQKCYNNTIAQCKLPSSPSSSKPKTPTIKCTKEKALSLDSAAVTKDCLKASRLKPALNLSCDEIDSSMHENKQKSQSHNRWTSNVPHTRSTSLSQLTTHNNNVCSLSNKGVLRRRNPTSTSVDWQLQQRKPSLYNIPDITKKICENRDDKAVVILKEDVLKDSQRSFPCSQTPSSINCASTPSSHRTTFKHNPLLHNSNTNLKTLPEFLTLVEFSNPSGEHVDPPFKPKSMDIPSHTAAANIRTRAAITSSTNLLQRRGSNHSLTLNLHGSCGNLLGSCRSGISVSNYSLGSVGNSNSNLNSKSSCNLNLAPSQNTQSSNVTTSKTAQGTKQSLFRRRGSNQSLTLTNLTAASCGNLNSFASQNSLNVERAQLITLPRPIANISLSATPRKGLLERRGSNQSLTLNMSSSFGGIASEKGILGNSTTNLEDTKAEQNIKSCHQSLISNCSIHSHQRRFFSNESLNRNNAQFSELHQTNNRNSNQVCFGSATDLKPNDPATTNQASDGGGNSKTHTAHFNFQEPSVCTCSGVRNIMTKPLSPQTTSEEFKIYLANIQMLQNASNVLNQNDLIKLNYIFDNSYATNSKSISDQALPILNMPASNKEAETPPPSLINSEDSEIIDRYLHVVKNVLDDLQLDDEEQKRMFRSLHKEFWDLPLNHQEKPMIFGSQTKNRYKTILPNENSRVVLERESKQLSEMIRISVDCNEELISDITKKILISDEVPYINANYIKGPDSTSKCYIATQGPLPNTIYEFWIMIYQNTKKYIEISRGPESPSCRQGKCLQQYYPKIIMLTNFIENNRQKCSVYFPVDLNDIFISTSTEEVVKPNDKFRVFIDTILESSFHEDDATISKAKGWEESVQMVTIDTMRAQLEKPLEDELPCSSTFFVIKNVGIVRKNGFSIRKLIVLYCAKLANNLFINKFFAYHYWYPDWPDHRSPRDINTLLDISLHVINLGKCEAEFQVYREATPSPSSHINAQSIELYQQDIFNAVQPLPVIHCSAGIGRTGCMTAIVNGIRQVRQTLAYSLTSMATKAAKQATSSETLSPVDFRLPKQFLEDDSMLSISLPTDMDCSFTRNTLLYIRYILKMENEINQRHNVNNERWTLPSLAELPKMSNIFVDVLGIVCNLRLQRGGMVQNSEQYELIHRAICLYLKRTFALKRF